jgi:hypothetical protein
MEEGKVPDQEAIDDIRSEARVEALKAVVDLERVLRGDEGMGGMDAILLGVLSQQVTERVRVYRMAVNVGETPTISAALADADQSRRLGIGRRRRRP